MSRKNVLIAIAVVLVGAAVVAANLYFKRDKGLAVTTDVIKTRDLEAVVSASGKIQPKHLVNISAETPGRVVNLAVNEGDRIKKGQLLLQIDPKSLRTRVDSGNASLVRFTGNSGSSNGNRDYYVITRPSMPSTFDTVSFDPATRTVSKLLTGEYGVWVPN